MCLSVLLTKISNSVLTLSSGPLGETCLPSASFCAALQEIRYLNSNKLVIILKLSNRLGIEPTDLVDGPYRWSYLSTLFKDLLSIATKDYTCRFY